MDASRHGPPPLPARRSGLRAAFFPRNRSGQRPIRGGPDCSWYILIHMKQILLELDDACARDLERVAPAGKRIRAEFIRLALRRAIDLALDRETEAAYRKQPLRAALTSADLADWDGQNELAKPASPSRARRRKRRAA
jgi:hypothetical protein